MLVHRAGADELVGLRALPSGRQAGAHGVGGADDGLGEHLPHLRCLGG